MPFVSYFFPFASHLPSSIEWGSAEWDGDEGMISRQDEASLGRIIPDPRDWVPRARNADCKENYPSRESLPWSRLVSLSLVPYGFNHQTNERPRMTLTITRNLFHSSPSPSISSSPGGFLPMGRESGDGEWEDGEGTEVISDRSGSRMLMMFFLRCSRASASHSDAFPYHLHLTTEGGTKLNPKDYRKCIVYRSTFTSPHFIIHSVRLWD